MREAVLKEVEGDEEAEGADKLTKVSHEKATSG